MPFSQKIRLALKTLIRVVDNALFLRFKTGIKLNLGAGGTRMGSYINVDSLFMRETDLLCELQHIPWFVREGSVTHIYASHVFEHFTVRDVRRILRLCYRLLEPGGEMRISVPDFEKVASLYLAHRDELGSKKILSWMGVVYGGQSTRYDFHKTGFIAPWLAGILEECGFSDPHEYDAEAFLAPYNVKDSSLYKKEFGDYISLNMVAVKK